MSILAVIRYRFFFFAGFFPYLLGQAIAFGTSGLLDWSRFSWGLAGVFLILMAVELFNEYFDDRTGGDRIFAPEKPVVPAYFFSLGIAATGVAFLIGLYLTARVGWPVLAFAFLGFLGAYFYVGPPIRWAYRGLGELTIALCYGPLMVLGSSYIQTGTIGLAPLFASLICAWSIFCLAVLNEIPDYYQDRLVGKRNLVVRLGRQRAAAMLRASLPGLFLLLLIGVVLRIVPWPAVAAFVMLPLVLKSAKNLGNNYDKPENLLGAVNAAVLNHVVIALSLSMAFVVGHLL